MHTLETLIQQSPQLIVYDTEFTTWEGAIARGWTGAGEHRELVHLAAQKIDLTTGVVLDSFDRLVVPRINRQLSTYFIDLTGITQAHIESTGEDFSVVYTALLEWSAGLPFFSYSKTITDYTDADVLQENITLYKLPITLPRERFHLLSPVFRSAGIDTTQYNSGRLYQALNLDLTGHEHNAMFDVTSLVQSLFLLAERLKKP
jgi:inhibitor of KinA sporulation pathway (predicted exonuclease)